MCEKNLMSYAESKGFMVKYSDGDKERIKKGIPPCDPPSFYKGRFHIWKNGQSDPVLKIWWRRAELINGRFTTHVTFDELNAALDSVE